MNPELKKILDDLNMAFSTFRAANDERLKAIESNKPVDALLTAKVDKANADVSALTTELTLMRAAIRESETANARMVLTANGSPEQALQDRHIRAFFSMVRGGPVEAISAQDRSEYEMYGVALNAYMRKGDKALKQEFMAALQTGSMPDGGYLVRPDTSGRIVQKIYETSPIRQLASQMTIGTDTLEGMNDLGEGSVGWVGEQTTRAETGTPQLGKWEIAMREMYAFPKATQKMLDDSEVNVEAWLADKVASKMARTENTAFVSGDGVLQPRGFLTYPSGTAWKQIEQKVTGANGAFVATPNSGDCILDLITSLKADLRGGASFVMASTTLALLRKIKDSQGQYLLIPNFAENPSGSVMGFKITEFADMPVVATNSLSIAFANWAETYTILDHAVGTRVLRDPFTAKPYIGFYTTKRVGGDVINFEAIKLLKFST